MAEEVRARIAQILYGDGDEIAWGRAVELADLIIWETGLRQEWAYSKPKRRLSASEYRFVTEWTRDE